MVTGNGLKDVANAIKAAGEPISIPSDMDRLLAAFAEKGITVNKRQGAGGLPPALFLEKFSDPRNDSLPFSDDIGESSFHKERDYRSGYGEEAGRSSGKGLLGPVSRRHRAFLTFPAQII